MNLPSSTAPVEGIPRPQHPPDGPDGLLEPPKISPPATGSGDPAEDLAKPKLAPVLLLGLDQIIAHQRLERLRPLMGEEIPGHVLGCEQRFVQIAVRFEPAAAEMLGAQMGDILQADEALDDGEHGALAPRSPAVNDQKALSGVPAEQHRAEVPLQQIHVLLRQRGLQQFVEKARALGIGTVVDGASAPGAVGRLEGQEDRRLDREVQHSVADVDEQAQKLWINREREALQERQNRVQEGVGPPRQELLGVVCFGLLLDEFRQQTFDLGISLGLPDARRRVVFPESAKILVEENLMVIGELCRDGDLIGVSRPIVCVKEGAVLLNDGINGLQGNFNIVVTSNNRLRVAMEDDEPAWRRRLLVIRFAGEAPQKRISNFAEVLLREEGEGILAWMVEGALKHLEELEETGDFKLTQAQQTRVEDLLQESKSAAVFVENQVIKQRHSDITVEELTQAYLDYCRAKGWTAFSERQFENVLNELMQRFHGVSRRKDITRKGKALRDFMHVTFKPEAQK